MKSKKFKKVLALSIASIMTLGLVACGGSSSDDKEITVKFSSFWVGNDSKANMMTELITQFNEENAGKIKVEVEEIADYDSYESKMKTSISANTVPDVFIFKTGEQALPYYKSDKLMDLTTYMDDGWKDDFVEGSLDDASYEGKTLAIPYEYGVTPVIYNSEMVKAAGFDEFPTNYDDFFKMCDAMKANGVAPISMMTGDNAWTSMLWYSQLVVAIGGQDVYDNGLEDPAFEEAAEVLLKMFDYTTTDAVGADANVAGGHWLNNETAMLMNGPWYLGRIATEGADGLYDKTEIAPAPAYEGGKGEDGGYIGFVQSNIGAAVQKDADKEAAVVKFLKFLSDPTNVGKISADSGSMFCIKTSAADDTERLQGEMIDQLAAAPYAVPHFQLMVNPSVATEFPQALSSMVLGETTPAEFVEALQAAGN
ncbi:MAG: ABC transporter substrate-binding protein [Clostridiaceae bacterium]